MIICDPNQLAEYSFDHDKSKPPKVRPTFIVKAMSSAEFHAYRNRVDTEVIALANPQEQFAAAEKLLHEYIIGLRNMTKDGKPVELTPDLKFESFLSRNGFWELLYNLGNASAPTESDFLR